MEGKKKGGRVGAGRFRFVAKKKGKSKTKTTPCMEEGRDALFTGSVLTESLARWNKRDEKRGEDTQREKKTAERGDPILGSGSPRRRRIKTLLIQSTFKRRPRHEARKKPAKRKKIEERKEGKRAGLKEILAKRKATTGMWRNASSPLGEEKGA